MPEHNRDLHGNVPDQAPAALLLIDVINDFDFPGGDELLQQALPMAQALAKLKRKARERRIPAIYVNDNFGRWRSDFHTQVERCTAANARGRQLVERLLPEPDDYFVLKPKNSGFYSTVLETLLRYLQVRTIILSGLTGDNCVLFTAQDGFLRDYELIVLSDCVASIDADENRHALDQIRDLLKGEVVTSTELDWRHIVGNSTESLIGPF